MEDLRSVARLLALEYPGPLQVLNDVAKEFGGTLLAEMTHVPKPSQVLPQELLLIDQSDFVFLCDSPNRFVMIRQPDSHKVWGTPRGSSRGR